MAQTGNIGDVAAKSFAELLSGPLVDIYVGETKRHWSLHRNLLAYHSEYLQSELHVTPETTPKKSKSAVESLRLDLPDDDPAGFELLVKWLYQGKLDDVSNISEDNDKYEYAVACQKLHQICDRFEMPKLKNMAMDQYRKGLNQAGLVPDAEELNVIYRQSLEHSPFRRLMVKIAARQIMDPETDKDAESYRECFQNNSDFAVDLVNAIKEGMGGLLFEDPTEKTDCEYHDHDGTNCHVRGKKKLACPNQTRNAAKWELSITPTSQTKVVSRSIIERPGTPESPSPAPAIARSEDWSAAANTPQINGFAERDDRFSDASGETGDFQSALSDTGSFDSAVTRITAATSARSPSTPGRKAPRKLVKRSGGDAGDRGAANKPERDELGSATKEPEVEGAV